MGPTRLRRGYSLEVIFEEDSDFCSHLDSLDSTRATGSGSNHHESNQISLDSLLVEEVEEEEDDELETSQDFSPSPFASFDQVFDIRDMESCLVEWQGPAQPKPEGASDKEGLEIGDGRQSRVSRRQILKSTWLLESTQDCADIEDEELIVPQLTSSIKVGTEIDYDSDSTLTDDTDTHTYAFADAHDEAISIASSATLDSESLLLLSSSYNSSQALGENSSSPTTLLQEMDPTAEALALDVKRVREIFEQRQKLSRNPAASAYQHQHQQPLPPTLPPRHPAFDSGVNKSASPTNNASSPVSNNKWMKSPLSQSSTHLNQLASYDLVDLLVNDRVVIEDSPDIFQTTRSTTKSTGNKRSAPEPCSSLRRCKSMSTGIFSPDIPTHGIVESVSRQSCILAEEMPAPNLVKNVRNVFERLCSQRNGSSSKWDAESDRNKKAPLRSIKSNPTSKILRSESLRDDNSHGEGKKLREKAKLSPQRQGETKVEETNNKTRSCNNNNNGNSNNKTRTSTTTITSTNGSSKKDPELTSNSDDDELKYIPADVLSRIRSHGTTTTYFGGEIVAKTVKNRKLLLPNNLTISLSPSSTTNTTPDLLHHSEFLLDSRQQILSENNSGGLILQEQFLDLGNSTVVVGNNPGNFDSTPRIVNVFPKSPWSKNTSPNGSIITSGRNSPEGCESQEVVVQEEPVPQGTSHQLLVIVDDLEGKGGKDSNNNLMIGGGGGSPSGKILGDFDERKFSETNEGAWF